MKLKAPDIEIPPADPFKNDLLGRRESANALTELICTTQEPLVLSINASWGEGKTTFLKMWRQMLENKEVKTLYFNAWENDFSDEAFVSLIGELEFGIEGLSLKSPDESKEQLLKAKKFASSLIRRGIPTAVKLATAGLVNLDELSEVAIAEYGEKLAEEQVRHYEDSKKSVKGFKQALSDLATAISDAEKPLPLVILIDELDRCRPLYAVQILEAVKHFFSVPNVVFVLALDRKQLGYSICSMYGAGMDVSGYLRRFIDIDYNLPHPKKGAFSKAQFARFGVIDLLKKRTTRDSPYEFDNLDTIFSELFEILGCSLREQERSFALLSMAIRTTPTNYPIHPILLGALIILKIKNHELYKDFVQKKVVYSDVLIFIGNTPAGKAFLSGHHGSVLEAFLACSASRHHEASDISQKYSTVFMNSADEIEKARAQKVLNVINTLISEDRYGTLEYLVGKIDLASNFRD
jgi:hypothetical protein